MSQRDYVSRGRAPQKKQKNKKTTSNARNNAGPLPAKTVSWVAVGVVLALLVGFAYFLWSIKDNVEPDGVQPLAKKPVAVEDELPSYLRKSGNILKRCLVTK